MTDVGDNHEDYTNITIGTIISVSILVIIYLILSGVGANISENSKTFNSKSWPVFYSESCVLRLRINNFHV